MKCKKKLSSDGFAEVQTCEQVFFPAKRQGRSGACSDLINKNIGSDKITFKKTLCDIVTMPHAQLLSYANQANEVKKRFNCKIWAEQMAEIEQ